MANEAQAQLIAEIWEVFRDFVPAAKRNDIAIQVLKTFEEYGYDPDDFKELVDEDRHLNMAYQDLYAEYLDVPEPEESDE